MMQRDATGRVVNAEGIRFRGVDYVAPELGYYRERGLRLTVRYLKRETRFIEVFDGDTWVCRAIDRTLLTESQRRAILLGRERDLDAAQAHQRRRGPGPAPPRTDRRRRRLRQRRRPSRTLRWKRSRTPSTR